MITIEISDDTLDKILDFFFQVFEPVKNTPDRRAQILEVLKEHGPLRLYQLQEIFGLSKNTIKDHLRKLIERGYVSRQGWAYGIARPGETDTLPVVRTSREQRIQEIMFYLSTQVMRVSDLSKKTGLSEPSIQNYLKYLVESKLVTRFRQGNTYYYKAVNATSKYSLTDFPSETQLRILLSMIHGRHLLKGIPRATIITYRTDLRKKGLLKSIGHGQKYELTEKGLDYLTYIFHGFTEAYGNEYRVLENALSTECLSLHDLVEKTKLPVIAVQLYLALNKNRLEVFGRNKRYYRHVGAEALPGIDCDTEQRLLRARILLQAKPQVTIPEFEEYVYKYNHTKIQRLTWRKKLGIIFTDTHVMHARDCPHSRSRAFIREGEAFCRWCGVSLEPSHVNKMEIIA